MRIPFWKYQSNGNDFIIVDATAGDIQLSDGQVEQLCHRRFGIGSDGLLQLKMNGDILMVDFMNPDASRSFCGNGSRAAVLFAQHRAWIDDEVEFEAIDGRHRASIQEETVSITMQDVANIEALEHGHYLDTGSPHVVIPVKELDAYPVSDEGARIRYAEQWSPGGVNVNFMQVKSEAVIAIRTYERGVEAETLSCGTGITAAALVHAHGTGSSEGRIEVQTVGGKAWVIFKKRDSGYSELILSGPSAAVFQGWVEI